MEQAVGVYQELGDIRGEGYVLGDLGLLSVTLRHYSKAVEIFERALALMQRTGDRFREAAMVETIATMYMRLGSNETAQEYLSKALERAHAAGWLLVEYDGLAALGRLRNQEGKYREAETTLRTALELVSTNEMRLEKAATFASLGESLVALSRLDEAEVVLQEAVTIYREFGWDHQAVAAITDLATIELARGNRHEALRIVEQQLLPTMGNDDFGDEEFGRAYWGCYQVLRAVDDPRAETVLRSGHDTIQSVAALIDKEALRRSFLENIPAHRAIIQTFSERSRLAAANTGVDPLTRQEREVLRLIAEGLTNKEIAERLVIAVGTVKNHTHSLFDKLGVSHRTQAITRAREIGLL
jgi:LuxR family maltose regulon positive regulatory protein